MTKKVFFVSPIGSDGSQERKTSDFVLKSIITPVAAKLGYETYRSDLINSTNTIDQDILGQLNNADLVIADVSGTNSNVMFELGYRMALKLPFIVISQTIKDLPFDIQNVRVMTYEHTSPDVDALQLKLEQSISIFQNVDDKEALNEEPVDFNKKGEEIGQQMLLDAISTGDFTTIENFAKLAKTFGIK